MNGTLLLCCCLPLPANMLTLKYTFSSNWTAWPFLVNIKTCLNLLGMILLFHHFKMLSIDLSRYSLPLRKYPSIVMSHIMAFVSETDHIYDNDHIRLHGLVTSQLFWLVLVYEIDTMVKLPNDASLRSCPQHQTLNDCILFCYRFGGWLFFVIHVEC